MMACKTCIYTHQVISKCTMLHVTNDRYLWPSNMSFCGILSEYTTIAGPKPLSTRLIHATVQMLKN